MPQILDRKTLAGDHGTDGSTPNVLFEDVLGNALMAHGTTVPADAGKAYAKGCIFFHTDAATGAGTFINAGTKTSCKFREFGSFIDDTTGTGYTMGVSNGTFVKVEV